MSVNTSDNLLEQMSLELDSHFQDVVKWRRHLHKHPELSFQETETAKFIETKLRRFGLKVTTNIGGNGLIGVLTGQHPGKTIAFRADFDALPIQDKKDVSYKSGSPGVMHACGHDGHTAALLGTAQTLSQYREYIHGQIVFLFQPAEETPPGGAKFMIEDGVLDEVDTIFGAHLASDIPLGKVAVGEGYKMAAVDKFKITIKGHGGHGGRPHKTVDPIVIGSEVVGALQKIVSRHIDPLQPAVISIGSFHAGNAFNVIPNEAVLEGTVRTFNEDVRKQIKHDIHTLTETIAGGSNATAEIAYLFGYPALFNHHTETAIARKLFEETFSKDNVISLTQGMGAEDFAYYLLEKPGTYFRVGSRTDDVNTHYAHHHEKFDIDERALLLIEKSFIKLALHYLAQ